MERKQHAFILPGLGDKVKQVELATRIFWKNSGIIPHIIAMNWYDKDEVLDAKLGRILSPATKLKADGNDVVIMGVSAGASAAGNLFIENPTIFSKFINIGGRLKAGDLHPLDPRTLDWAARKSPIFKESVLRFESNESKLAPKRRADILCLQPLFDEVVPRSTSSLPGANNQYLWSVEHVITDTLALTLMSNQIFRFLRR